MMATLNKQPGQFSPLPAHFDIFSAFEKLETSRKLSLCDQLFHAGNFAFFNMVQKFWPDANEMDSMKLERLLRTRVERSLQQ